MMRTCELEAMHDEAAEEARDKPRRVQCIKCVRVSARKANGGEGEIQIRLSPYIGSEMGPETNIERIGQR